MIIVIRSFSICFQHFTTFLHVIITFLQSTTTFLPLHRFSKFPPQYKHPFGLYERAYRPLPTRPTRTLGPLVPYQAHPPPGPLLPPHSARQHPPHPPPASGTTTPGPRAHSTRPANSPSHPARAHIAGPMPAASSAPVPTRRAALRLLSCWRTRRAGLCSLLMCMLFFIPLPTFFKPPPPHADHAQTCSSGAACSYPFPHIHHSVLHPYAMPCNCYLRWWWLLEVLHLNPQSPF